MSIVPFLLKCAQRIRRSAAWCADLMRHCSEHYRRLSHPYRPEFHYMRGPGPKWREKHPDSQSHPTRLRKS
jgi:hypothetical protein